MFHESTVEGLKFYDRPGWQETAEFISYIVKLWNIMSVRTPNKGENIIAEQLDELNLLFKLI